MTIKETSIENSFSSTSFDIIKYSTLCPFAKKADIWTSDTENKSLEFGEVLLNAAHELTRFTSVSETEKLDGYVLEINGQEYNNALEVFTQTFLNTLLFLNKNDPKQSNCMSENIEGPEWQFTFNDQRLFIITFAPFYAQNHPRYSFTDTSSFIFFQPETSFDSKIIPPPQDPRVLRLKKSIRDEFKANGRGYDENIADLESEAYKYIKPLRIGDPPVRWWIGKT